MVDGYCLFHQMNSWFLIAFSQFGEEGVLVSVRMDRNWDWSYLFEVTFLYLSYIYFKGLELLFVNSDKL